VILLSSEEIKELNRTDIENLRNHVFFKNVTCIFAMCNKHYNIQEKSIITKLLVSNVDYIKLLDIIIKLNEDLSVFVRLIRDHPFLNLKPIKNMLEEYTHYIDRFSPYLDRILRYNKEIEVIFPQLLGKMISSFSKSFQAKYNIGESLTDGEMLEIVVPDAPDLLDEHSSRDDYMDAFCDEPVSPPITADLVNRWNGESLLGLLMDLEKCFLWLRDGLNTLIPNIKLLAVYEHGFNDVVECSVRILENWQQNPPPRSEKFDENSWRDDFYNKFLLVYDQSKIRDITREEIRKEGRTDILLTFASGKKAIIEFKRWNNPDKRDVINQIITRYSKVEDKFGIVIMICSLQSESKVDFKEYESVILHNPTAMLNNNDVNLILWGGEDGMEIIQSNHLDNNMKIFKITHLLYNKHRYW